MNDLANFGDSVHWGQGHPLEKKFAYKVAAALGLKLQMNAHSGATIGIDAVCQGSTDGEVPFAYPTILQQVRNYSADPNQAALVLLNGGINNVSVRHIINPLVTPAEIKRVTREYCHADMVKLLGEMQLKFSKPDTTIIVTSYFPIFSRVSDFKKIVQYLTANMILVPTGTEATEQQISILNRIVDNAQAFWKESTQSLQDAVHEVGSRRVKFAEIPFTDDNSMFAPDPWLFGVHLKNGVPIPEDSVAAQRRVACDLFHHNPFDRTACYIASTGHPNEKGSQKYADTILTVVRTR